MLRTMVDSVLEAEKRADQMVEEAKQEYGEMVSKAREDAEAEFRRLRLEEESRAAQELQKEAVWWEAWKKQVMEETKEEEARLWAQARERKDEVAAVMLKILLEGREE